ncbi:Flp family type IVb pilin [Pseudodesulfovibrio cashew]|uniref:Flp family type IVb pilin n=1 Tax=Pseudodesulfovibrio cashew TaxID=2678688 RepID=A0A6I6J8F3_9BACT|nr:Flp family type IVb pilin [Pseudodesulfovibrio cashew]QGY38845.1 Flp family type IVb pilin [Pseudodesulfovibrio cashew]
MTRLLKEERGATALEYGLIGALIAVAIMGVVSTLGLQIQTIFSTIATTIATTP